MTTFTVWHDDDAETGPERVTITRQDQLPGLEEQPSLFSPEDRDLLDAIAAQASEADYEATADLLRAARATGAYPRPILGGCAPMPADSAGPVGRDRRTGWRSACRLPLGLFLASRLLCFPWVTPGSLPGAPSGTRDPLPVEGFAECFYFGRVAVQIDGGEG